MPKNGPQRKEMPAFSNVHCAGAQLERWCGAAPISISNVINKHLFHSQLQTSLPNEVSFGEDNDSEEATEIWRGTQESEGEDTSEGTLPRLRQFKTWVQNQECFQVSTRNHSSTSYLVSTIPRRPFCGSVVSFPGGFYMLLKAYVLPQLPAGLPGSKAGVYSSLGLRAGASAVPGTWAPASSTIAPWVSSTCGQPAPCASQA